VQDVDIILIWIWKINVFYCLIYKFNPINMYTYDYISTMSGGLVMRKHLPIESLRTFVSVIETGSFTRAGRVVGRSQSAVSLQIQRLECLCGASLLMRDSRAPFLTRQGEILLETAREILALNDACFDVMGDPFLSGSIRVGIPNDFATSILPQVLGRFTKAHPNVNLEVTCDLSATLGDHFESSDLDVMIGIRTERTTAKPLKTWSEPVVWVAGGDQNTETRSPLPLVVYPEGCRYRTAVFRALEAAEIPSRIAFCSASLSGLQMAVKSGLGVMALSRSTVPEGLHPLSSSASLPDLGMVLIDLFARMDPPNAPAEQLARFVEQALDEIAMHHGHQRIRA